MTSGVNLYIDIHMCFHSQVRIYLRSRGSAREVHPRHAGPPRQAGHRTHGLRRTPDYLCGVQGLRAWQG